ncbi:MAG: metabolite traffic protein EboE [Planctomycetes bacterium]|nr:metabolite traffic protein EboE [Planctomycetota bacterium]
MRKPTITYCGNVHPAATLDEWLGVLAGPSARVARASREPGAVFPLGVWWTAATAATLARDASARERVRAALERERLRIATLNVFPYGGFHDAVVKAAVYRPDWADDRRLRFTLDAARAVAAFAKPGDCIPLSTLPLGFGAGDLGVMAEQLRVVGRELARLEAETGVRCVLALEPEPDCLLERVSEAAGFLDLRVMTGRDDEALLRRHLGVCVDLCHLAVVGEDAAEAFEALDAHGVEPAKVQVSSCLELRDGRELDRLLAFDEPRYLHQTVADSGRLRALDLDEVRERRDEFATARRIRTHFHVPVFWDDPGVLGSTQAELRCALRVLPADLALLEVETYTWSVLGRQWTEGDDFVAGIVRELAWLREESGSLP